MTTSAGRRLLAAVFTAYQLDPGFFEQEVLPVFVDVPLSHAPAIRLLQMEELLCRVPHGVAVYFDAAGLVPNTDSAKLDVARVPVRVPTGIFHPKNVLALVESKEPDEDGKHRRSLIVACMSANLTRSGWWENVEVAHVEELAEGERSRLRAGLRQLITSLRRYSSKGSDHRALNEIRKFVNRTDEHPHRSKHGKLSTHLWTGPESLVEFLRETIGDRLRGLHLDVISPYFSHAAEGDSGPLEALRDAFEPKSCRVFLPKSASGAALVDPKMYARLAELPGVEWGTLPSAVTRLGKSKHAGDRFVHAKVYRFYSRSPKRELLLVGSPNLTQPAHQHGGNLETAFLVEREPTGRPSSWLEPEERPTTSFAEPEDGDRRASDGGTRLELRFDWLHKTASAHWSDKQPSPRLCLRAQGSPLFELDGLPASEWTPLDPQQCSRIGQLLTSTTLVEVEGGGELPGLLLVAETNMAHKPSLLLSLSAEDILRYWSLLSDDQRAAFIESRAPELLFAADGGDLVTRNAPLVSEGGMFDRFAGLFHAFDSLERLVRDALASQRPREAATKLFGQKYDSLGALLRRITEPDEHEHRSFRSPVDCYLVALCAKQLLERVQTRHAEFWHAHEAEAVQIVALQQRALEVRDELLRDQPNADQFLRWYESWFVRHAAELEDRG